MYQEIFLLTKREKKTFKETRGNEYWNFNYKLRKSRIKIISIENYVTMLVCLMKLYIKNNTFVQKVL